MTEKRFEFDDFDDEVEMFDLLNIQAEIISDLEKENTMLKKANLNLRDNNTDLRRENEQLKEKLEQYKAIIDKKWIEISKREW